MESCLEPCVESILQPWVENLLEPGVGYILEPWTGNIWNHGEYSENMQAGYSAIMDVEYLGTMGGNILEHG